MRIDDFKYRFIDQPGGWLGEKTKPDVPYLINLRLDPFERTGWPNSGTKEGAQQYFEWFKYEFWRFVFVQQQVEKLAMTAIEFPPMQKGASFNLDAVKAKIEAATLQSPSSSPLTPWRACQSPWARPPGPSTNEGRRFASVARRSAFRGAMYAGAAVPPPMGQPRRGALRSPLPAASCLRVLPLSALLLNGARRTCKLFKNWNIAN